MQPKIDLSIIVAMTRERVIGRGDKLPWRIPSDLKRFRDITMRAGIVILGRRTFDSIIERNGKPLERRKHIVLTRTQRRERFPTDQILLVGSPEEAIAEVSTNGGKACIIGGEEIYKLFLPMPEVKTLYLTLIREPVSGDVFFPDIGGTGWVDVEYKTRTGPPVGKWHDKDEYSTSFAVYCRRSLD